MSNQLLECSPVLHRYLLTFIWSSASQLNGERLHLRTSYSDRGELGLLPTSLQRTCPGWRTRTRIGKPKEWSTENWKLRADEDKRDPQGVKMPENDEWNLGVPTFSDGECFLLKLLRQCHRSLGLRFTIYPRNWLWCSNPIIEKVSVENEEWKSWNWGPRTFPTRPPGRNKCLRMPEEKPWSPAFSDCEGFLLKCIRQCHRSLGKIIYALSARLA